MWMRRGVLAASTSDVLSRTADTGGERLQRSTQPQFVALSRPSDPPALSLTAPPAGRD